MDNLTPKQRKYNMTRIRSKNTTPEMIVRKFLFGKGLRYRLHDKSLPGTPDIVLKRYRTVIFIHGCFWHFHQGCRYAVMPKNNREYWSAKIQRNLEKDKKNFEELKALGWNIVIVWECELKAKDREMTLERVYYETIYEAGPNNFNLDQLVSLKKTVKDGEVQDTIDGNDTFSDNYMEEVLTDEEI